MKTGMIKIRLHSTPVKQVDHNKPYTCNFLEPGLVSYEDMGAGVSLLQKETIDKMLNSIVGCPVIIDHQDGTAEEIFNEKRHVGTVTEAVYNADTGWFDCSFTLDNDKDGKAKRLVDRGYSVSCAFNVLDVAGGGSWHGIDYDETITEGTFTHLALVDNPRYEDCKIRMNSKGKIKAGHIMKKENTKENDRQGQVIRGPINGLSLVFSEGTNQYWLMWKGQIVKKITDKSQAIYEFELATRADNKKENATTPCPECGKPATIKDGVATCKPCKLEITSWKKENKRQMYGDILEVGDIIFYSGKWRKIKSRNGVGDSIKLEFNDGTSATVGVHDVFDLHNSVENASTPEQIARAISKVPELLRTLGYDSLASQASSRPLAALKEAAKMEDRPKHAAILKAAIDALIKEGVNNAMCDEPELKENAGRYVMKCSSGHTFTISTAPTGEEECPRCYAPAKLVKENGTRKYITCPTCERVQEIKGNKAHCDHCKHDITSWNPADVWVEKTNSTDIIDKPQGETVKFKHSKKEKLSMFNFFKKKAKKENSVKQNESGAPVEEMQNAAEIFVQIDGEMVPVAELLKYRKAEQAEDEVMEELSAGDTITDSEGKDHDLAQLINSFKEAKNSSAKQNADAGDAMKKDAKVEGDQVNPELMKVNAEEKKEGEDKKENADEEKKPEAEEKKNEGEDCDKPEAKKENAKAPAEKDVSHFVKLNAKFKNADTMREVMYESLNSKVERGQACFGSAKK